jgi:hypothetical protein
VNLRHFFVPREVVPRTMSERMPVFDWCDNPDMNHFCHGLTEIPK